MATPATIIEDTSIGYATAPTEPPPTTIPVVTVPLVAPKDAKECPAVDGSAPQKRDFKAEPLKSASENVPGEDGAAVTEVGKGVDGGSAGVERKLPRLAWNELDQTANSGVVEGNHALQVTAMS